MKKVFLSLVFVVVMCSFARADLLTLGDIPETKQGVAWSMQDNKLNYLATVEIVKVWKGLSLEAGYAGVAKNTGDKLVLVASYDLFTASDVTTLPIVKYLTFRPGVYAGYGRVTLDEGQGKGNNEFDWGVSATFLDIKF